MRLNSFSFASYTLKGGANLGETKLQQLRYVFTHTDQREMADWVAPKGWLVLYSSLLCQPQVLTGGCQECYQNSLPPQASLWEGTSLLVEYT